MRAPTAEMEALKSRLKATWMAGDFGVIAKMTEQGAEEFIARLAIAPNTRVLDVACGSGNLAVPAARGGARVTGVDIATNLLEEARARAGSERLTIRFDEGDAEQLPYADQSFDVVMSMFGVMFAPRPDVAAAELVRVTRAGGRIALGNWTPGSFAGEMFGTLGKHVPPPPDMAPPVQWGDESIVRQRLSKGIADLTMTKRTFPIKFAFGPAEVVELFRSYFGPVNRAFDALDQARQLSLRRELEQVWSTRNRATDGTVQVDGEYLEVIATRS
jgi:SAM-dependent methyltransferase